MTRSAFTAAYRWPLNLYDQTIQPGRSQLRRFGGALPTQYLWRVKRANSIGSAAAGFCPALDRKSVVEGKSVGDEVGRSVREEGERDSEYERSIDVLGDGVQYY